MLTHCQCFYQLVGFPYFVLQLSTITSRSSSAFFLYERPHFWLDPPGGVALQIDEAFSAECCLLVFQVSTVVRKNFLQTDKKCEKWQETHSAASFHERFHIRRISRENSRWCYLTELNPSTRIPTPMLDTEKNMQLFFCLPIILVKRLFLLFQIPDLRTCHTLGGVKVGICFLSRRSLQIWACKSKQTKKQSCCWL